MSSVRRFAYVIWEYFLCFSSQMNFGMAPFTKNCRKTHSMGCLSPLHSDDQYHLVNFILPPLKKSEHFAFIVHCYFLPRKISIMATQSYSDFERVRVRILFHLMSLCLSLVATTIYIRILLSFSTLAFAHSAAYSTPPPRARSIL